MGDDGARFRPPGEPARWGALRASMIDIVRVGRLWRGEGRRNMSEREDTSTVIRGGTGSTSMSCPSGARDPGSVSARGSDQQAAEVVVDLDRHRGFSEDRDVSRKPGDVGDERLGSGDASGADAARSIGELILAKRLRILVDDALIEYSHWLEGSVLVDDHLLASEARCAPQPAGCQPPEFDIRRDARAESDGDERDVVDSFDHRLAPR